MIHWLLGALLWVRREFFTFDLTRHQALTLVIGWGFVGLCVLVAAGIASASNHRQAHRR